MLVLTRRSGEKITVGDEVVVTVLEVKGAQVKLGIEAPSGVIVHRGEVYDRIQKENERAAGVGTEDFDAAERLYRLRNGGDHHFGRNH